MKPHTIILFNPDQWRGDCLGHLGHPAAQTPVLDDLVAREAISVAGAYCQNPVCTPSRCSFLTGLYPHTRGHRSMYHMLQPEEPYLFEVLAREGWKVWWGGKNDVLPAQHPLRGVHVKHQLPAGLDPNAYQDPAWRGEPGGANWYSFHLGRLTTPHGGHRRDSDWSHVEGAIAAIRALPPDETWCFFLPLEYPHPPYGCEDPWFSAIDREAVTRWRRPTAVEGKPAILRGIARHQGLGVWSEAQWTELRATYLAMCARVDHQLGLLVQALKDAGRWDDALLLVFSDHGDLTGDYGVVEKTQNTFDEGQARVPLIVKPPGGAVPGVRQTLAELIDIPATIYDACGIVPGYSHFGRSLLPLCQDPHRCHRTEAYAEGGRRPGEYHCMELNSSPGGLNPASLYWPRLVLQAQDDGPEHHKATMLRHGRWKYVRRLGEEDQLYDLEEDPQEERNRIADPTLVPVLADLRDRMLTWYQDTADTVPYAADARHPGQVPAPWDAWLPTGLRAADCR